jgi:acetyl-CoA acetyltransferase
MSRPTTRDRPRAAIVGIGRSTFSLSAEASQTALAAEAMVAALADAGLAREAVDGISLHYGYPLGLDYDRVAQALGLNLRYVNQQMLNGRFTATALHHAALAVEAGLADVVACVTAVSFTRSRRMKAGQAGLEALREEGGTHGEAPAYGLSFPAAGAAIAARRYLDRYGLGPDALADVVVSIRAHAALNPEALMRAPITLEDYRASEMVVDPLRKLDCCLVSDGAVVVLVAACEAADDMAQKPVDIVGMQGMRAGREEYVFAPPGLGVFAQGTERPAPETEVFATSGVARSEIQGVYAYDAFSPLVLYALERFGYCGPGEGPQFVAGGRIGPGGALPVNTSGGLLSEAHVAGWASIFEMVRQLRGDAGARQIPGARYLHWATPWGDSVILGAREGRA